MQESERFAARVEGVSGSAIRELFKLTSRPGVISFGGGNPSPAALPDEIVADICRELVATNGKVLLQYGMTEGLPALRESLTGYLQSEFGVTTDAGCILPVTGSTQAFNLLLDAYTDPGDVILTENPTFLGATQAMHLHQLRVIPVDSDEQGLRVDALEEAIRRHRPRMLYTIPTFQNPTGLTTSYEKRVRIYELAKQYGVMILEDNPYGELRFSGGDVPTIKSMDTEGLVIYTSSFSKILSAGMRVGFVIAPEAVASKMVVAKQSEDVHTNLFFQMLCYRYMTECDLDAHIASIRALYRHKCGLMLDALDAAMPSCVTFTRPAGGLFIWVTLPEYVDMPAFLKATVAAGLRVVPGATFGCDPDAPSCCFRLNYSTPSDGQIRDGIRRLGTVVRAAVGDDTEGDRS